MAHLCKRGLIASVNDGQVSRQRRIYLLTYLSLSTIIPRMGQKKNPHAQALGSLGGSGARAGKLSDAKLTKSPARAGRQGPRSSPLRTESDREKWPLPPANARERRRNNAKPKADGKLVRIGDRWYVRYWERRNIGGNDRTKTSDPSARPCRNKRKETTCGHKDRGQSSHGISQQRGNSRRTIVTIFDFVERVYLPWVEQYKRPSTEGI